MSFLSTLKSIAVGLGKTVQAVEPIVSNVIRIADPAAAPALNIVDNLVSRIPVMSAHVEDIITTAKSGATKSDMVAADFEDGLATLKTFLEPFGLEVTYTPALQQAVTDASVALFNALNALKTDIKVTKVATQ